MSAVVLQTRGQGDPRVTVVHCQLLGGACVQERLIGPESVEADDLCWCRRTIEVLVEDGKGLRRASKRGRLPQCCVLLSLVITQVSAEARLHTGKRCMHLVGKLLLDGPCRARAPDLGLHGINDIAVLQLQLTNSLCSTDAFPIKSAGRAAQEQRSGGAKEMPQQPRHYKKRISLFTGSAQSHAASMRVAILGAKPLDEQDAHAMGVAST